MSTTCSHTSHPQPLNHTHPTPHSLTYTYLTATTSEPHQLYPPNSPSSNTCTSAHSQTHSSLFTASLTHSSLLTASHPLTATLLIASSHSRLPPQPPTSLPHSLPPSQQHMPHLPLHTVYPGPWWYQCQDPCYKVNQDSRRVALVTTRLPQFIQT